MAKLIFVFVISVLNNPYILNTHDCIPHQPSLNMSGDIVPQGTVDGSSSKPALRQDTKYMVEETYHIAPYLGALWAYLMPQGLK